MDEAEPDPAETGSLPRRSRQQHLEPQLRETRGGGDGTPFSAFTTTADAGGGPGAGRPEATGPDRARPEPTAAGAPVPTAAGPTAAGPGRRPGARAAAFLRRTGRGRPS